MARVYISSTFKDLEAERGAAFEAVRWTDHQPRGMEYYGASERRPLDVCLSDVASCQAYVGIIGWRYGYRPAEGGGKSFVRLEYEAAAAAGLRRLLYLSGEHLRPERPEPGIEGFRAKLQEELTVFHFDDPGELERQVYRDVLREIRSGPARPTILPYLCDRKPQETGLRDRLRAGDEPAPPLVCLVHGDDRQSIAQFVDCVSWDYLPRLLEIPRDQAPVPLLEVRWPSDAGSADRLHELLTWRLGEQTCERPRATVREIAAWMRQRRAPVLISCQVPRKALGRHGFDPLPAFIEYWRQWPPMPAGRRMVVLLRVEYPRAVGSWLQRRRRRKHNQRIRAALERLPGAAAGQPVMLPRLEDVREFDVKEWAALPEVRRMTRRADLNADIRNIFSRHEARPMEEVAASLQLMLQGRASTAAGRVTP